LLDAQMTVTIASPTGSWFCISHLQSPGFISGYIAQHSESARPTGPKSKTYWIGRCAKMNWIGVKLFLYYNVSKVGK
jgi:hypothetical protein